MCRKLKGGRMESIMKKIKSLITVVGLLSVFGLCGCASKEVSSEDSTKKENTEHTSETGEMKNTENPSKAEETKNTENPTEGNLTENAILVINNKF